MKSFLKNLGLFVIFSLSSYCIWLFLFGFGFTNKINSNLMYTPFEGGNHYRLQEAETKFNLDILFLGSSHAYRSFQTENYEILGWKSFNLGSSAQTHIQTNYLLKKYLKGMNPKLVVYEVYPQIFMGDGTESTINLISSLPDLDWNLLEMVAASNNLKVYNSTIFNFILKLTKTKPRMNSTFPLNKEDQYVSGGFVAKKLSFNEVKENIKEVPKDWEPKEEQVEHFFENLELIKNSGAKVILLQTPHTYTFSDSTQIDNFYSKLAPYYNLNYILKVNEVLDFYDSHHVNRLGAQKINKKLINIIISQNYLTPQ